MYRYRLAAVWLVAFGVASLLPAQSAEKTQTKGHIITVDLPVKGQSKLTCLPGWTVRTDQDAPVRNVPLQRGTFNMTRLNLVKGQCVYKCPSISIEFGLNTSCNSVVSTREFTKSVVNDWKEAMRHSVEDQDGNTADGEIKFVDKRIILKRSNGSIYNADMYICHSRFSSTWWTSCLVVAVGEKNKLKASSDDLAVYPIYSIETSCVKMYWDRYGSAIEKTIASFTSP